MVYALVMLLIMELQVSTAEQDPRDSKYAQLVSLLLIKPMLWLAQLHFVLRYPWALVGMDQLHPRFSYVLLGNTLTLQIQYVLLASALLLPLGFLRFTEMLIIK